MEILNKYNFKWPQALKFAIFAIVAIILLAFFFSLINATFKSSGKQGLVFPKGMAVSEMAMDEGVALSYKASDGMAISTRNVAAIMPEYDNGATGNTAEDFEITRYDASIETRRLDQSCAVIRALKTKEYIIFENASEYKTGCNYSFKVEVSHKEEVLNTVNELKPKNLTENTSSIKGQIDDFTSEEEILLKRQKTIENTLEDAIKSYDEIARVATLSRDAASLAAIIDSKIQIIERLSQQRIDISTQLDRLARSKTEQLDKLAYTFFAVNIYENKFVDWQDLRDSWKLAVKNLVNNINEIAQNISVNLVTVVLTIIQYALYLLILVFAVKYGFRIGKRIWKGKNS